MGKTNFLNRAFGHLSTFIHEVDLVVIMIVFSVYHYTRAMSLHDPALVVIPFAVGIDLLHFRITVHFMRNLRRWYIWLVPFAITLAIVSGLQLIYYLQPGDFGETLPFWQSAVYASIAPTAITLLAILREVDLKVEDFRLALQYARRLKTAERNLRENETRAELVESLRTAMRENETKMAELEAGLKRYEAASVLDETLAEKTEARLLSAETGRAKAEAIAREFETRLRRIESERSELEARLKKNETEKAKLETAVSSMKAELEELRIKATMVSSMSPLALDLLQVHVGRTDETQEELAARHHVSTGKVSTVKKYVLNGHGG